MDIFLIRHGQSNGNANSIIQGHSDEDLSTLGNKQALELSGYFNIGDLNAIYASDLKRAKYTAHPTAEKLNLKIILDSRLREADFGKWEGLRENEVKEKYPLEYQAWSNDYLIRPPWFESFENHQTRIKNSLEDILMNHSLSDKVAVFCHGGSIKTQVGYFNNLQGFEISKLAIPNCSLTLIKFNPSKDFNHGKMLYWGKNIII